MAAALTLSSSSRSSETGSFARRDATFPSPRAARTSSCAPSSACTRPTASRFSDPLGDPARRRARVQRRGHRRRADGRRSPVRAATPTCWPRRRPSRATPTTSPPRSRWLRDLRRRPRDAFDPPTRAGGAGGRARSRPCAREAARAALPAQVPIAEAVFNVAHAALLGARPGPRGLGPASRGPPGPPAPAAPLAPLPALLRARRAGPRAGGARGHDLRGRPDRARVVLLRADRRRRGGAGARGRGLGAG